MHSLVNTLHSGNRYLILVALLFVLYRSWSGWMGKKPYEKADNTVSAVLLGLSHLQLLLGLIQYFVTSAYTRGGLPISDPWVRYFKMEHISAMVLAIVLIQLGRTFSKKASDPVEKHKKVAVYTTIAALIIAGTLAMKGLLFGSVASGG
jgi:hypothetical protein